MESTLLSFLILALISYLMGSIPFGLILTRLSGAGNLRKIGSGNIGATNVLRTGRRWIALATLIMDIAKGAAPVLLAQYYSIDLAVIAGILTVIGHDFPIWLKFRGGKGVATTVGVFIAVDWSIGLAVIATWVLIAFISRYSSLAAICSLVCSPCYFWFGPGEESALLALILCALGVVRHLNNIKRLLNGDEAKIRLKKADQKY